MRISDWSSDVCSSDLAGLDFLPRQGLDDQAAQCRREREAEEIARGRAGEYAEACCAAGEARDPRRADRDVEQDGTSAERRVGTECVSTGRSRGSPYK